MRASDFERRGRFFQVQTIIDYRFGIADTPPTGNRETLDIEKAWRDVQAADTVAGLGPFVSAENQEIDTAGKHVNGKDAHALCRINHKNQFAFTTKSTQRYEILPEAGSELHIACDQNACFRSDAPLNIMQIDNASVSRAHKVNAISLLKPRQGATWKFIRRTQHVSAMLEDSGDQVHPV